MTGRVTLAVRAEFGIDGRAPPELSASADATWNAVVEDVYAYLATRQGGAVAHCRKNCGVVCEASFDSEGVASTRCAHRVLYLQQIERAMGVRDNLPTIIGTDSSSNLAVAQKQGAAARSKHSLRRWAALQRRMEDGEIHLVKLSTDVMPADFMTKFLPKKKFAASLAYATNSANAVPVHGLPR